MEKESDTVHLLKSSVGTKKSVTMEEKTISIPVAIFSAISVTVGAGMVSVPKTTLEAGIPFTIAYYTLNLILTIYSVHCLLESARVTGKYSMPRLAYDCFGYYSLYFVNFVQFIAFGVLPIAYFIIFAGISSSFLESIPGVEDSGWHFVGSQWFSVLILAALTFPLIIRKEISELSIAGALLFSGVIIFNVLLIVLKFDSNANISYKEEDSEQFYRFEVNQALLSSLSTAFIAFGFQSGFFPIYNSIENKSYSKGMKFGVLAMLYCFIIYVCIMFSGLYTFGAAIEGDVLKNVSQIHTWESYVLRTIFLLVMLTHTPFVFFIGKESILCIAVLLYQRFGQKGKYEEVEDDEEPVLLEPTNEIKGLQYNGRSRSKSITKSIVKKRLKHIGLNETISMNNMEVSISMAIPFSKRTMRTVEVVTDGGNKGTENLAAHSLLPNSIYYPVTLGLFVMVVGTACIIDDVESVIKYIGSLGNSVLNFVIPGVCYFIIMRKYEREKTATWKLACALGLAIYGGALALLCTGVNIWTTFQPLEDQVE